MNFLLRFWKRLSHFDTPLAVGSGLFVVLFGTFAIHYLEPETFPTLFESLWWTLTTLTTVGYGDYYPVSREGRLLGIFLFIFGIGVIGLVIGKFVDSLYSLRTLRKEGRLMYIKKNHYVYIGWSKKTEQAIHEVFAHDSHAEIVLIDELPESPVSHSQVHFIQGDPSDEEILEKANLFYAKRVAIFSDTKIDQTLLADGKTLLIASAVEAMCKEGGKNIHTIVEICEERNIPKFKHIDIDDFVLSNDGVSLLMAKATLHPGSTALFRQLLSKRTGDNIHELKPAPNWKTYRDASQAIFEQGGSLLAVNDQMDFTNASTQLLKETDTLYIVCRDETYLRVIRETGALPSD